jgi:hypothetical protein
MAVSVIQGSGQSGTLPGDVASVNTSSSCEDPTQNLAPLLEQHQGEESMYTLESEILMAV